jgi:hypothetical protein
LNVDSRPAQSKPGARFWTSGRLTFRYRIMEGLSVTRVPSKCWINLSSHMHVFRLVIRNLLKTLGVALRLTPDGISESGSK